MNTADFVWMVLLLEVVPEVVGQEETHSFLMAMAMAMAMAQEEQDSFPFQEAMVSSQVEVEQGWEQVAKVPMEMDQ